MRTARSLVRVLAFSAIALATSAAAAGPTPADRDAARALADAGYEAFQAGKYADAVAKFEGAEAKFHAPTNLLFLGQAKDKLGKLVAARAVYQQLATEKLAPSAPKAFRDAQAEAASALAALDKRIPTVKIVIRALDRQEVVDPWTSKARVTIDGGAPLEKLDAPVSLDPGGHDVVASVGDGSPKSSHVDLVEGAPTVVVELDLSARGPGVVSSAPPVSAPPPEAPVAASSKGSIVPAAFAFGLGAVGLGVGAITGVISLGKVSDLKSACPNNPCPSANLDLADSARTMGTVSTVAFVVGGVGVAAGVVLFVTRRTGPANEPPPPAASLGVGPGSLVLRGTF